MSKCDIHQEKIEHLKEEMAEMKNSFGDVVNDLKSATQLIMDAKNDISDVGNKTFNKLKKEYMKQWKIDMQVMLKMQKITLQTN